MNHGENRYIYEFRSEKITFCDTATYTDLWVQNEACAFVTGYQNPFSQLNFKEAPTPSTVKPLGFYFRFFFYLPEG